MAAAVALASAILFRFPPSAFPFYPACPIYLLLGIQCPGCGVTRALAALLHGRLHEALRSNALATCALPLVAAFGLHRSIFILLGHPLPPLRIPRATVYTSVVIATAFTILRNL